MLFRWVLLVVVSVTATVLLEVPRFPAALLLGPMAAGIALALAGHELRVQPILVVLSQGVVGVMIGAGFPHGFLTEMAGHWPLFLSGTLFTVVVSTVLGLLLAKSRLLPATTALWGFSAGAASVMTFMSQSYGADFRLVAFMQYLRVVCVALAAGVMVRLTAGGPDGAGITEWFPAIEPLPFLVMAGIAAGLSLLGSRSGLPGGTFLLPMAGGALATHGLGIETLPPQWLKAVAFAITGWAIGLRFTPSILAHAARVFPMVATASVVMILLNGAFAVALSRISGIDLLTAYLATSPGGADSVAIIAMTVPVNVAFVMTMQTARLLVVIAIAPFLAKRFSVGR
jgi:membrane AbrB-like protein